MSILKEYEDIKNKLGNAEWELIEEYVDKHRDIELSDVLYKEKEFDKFKDWKINKYIKETTDKVLNKANTVLQTEEYKGYSIDYILIDKKEENKSFAVLSNTDVVGVLELGKENIVEIVEWDYNYDTYFLEDLHTNHIGYISNSFHHNIMCSINETYPIDVCDKAGLQIYLKYCKDNNITNEIIGKSVKLDTPDVLKYQYDESVYYKDNKSIVMTGVRNKDTKIALIMKEADRLIDTEFIIAFNYKIDGDDISWGYGKYYGNDEKKAIKDIERAVAGHSLDNSFKKLKTERER